MIHKRLRFHEILYYVCVMWTNLSIIRMFIPLQKYKHEYIYIRIECYVRCEECRDVKRDSIKIICTYSIWVWLNFGNTVERSTWTTAEQECFKFVFIALTNQINLTNIIIYVWSSLSIVGGINLIMKLYNLN